ncbi:hypothetical protein ACFLQ8_02510 [Candidatus Auribacterota bacterium]
MYVHCPVCRELLEVDRENGNVVKHFKSKAAEKGGSGDLFTDAIEDVKNTGDKLESQFKDAKDKEKDKSKILDDAFKKGIDKAKKDKDKKPGLRPFDLD